MATWFLLNTIVLSINSAGSQKILPGTILDDAVIPLATLQGANASLWPTADPVVAAAALKVAQARAKGANETTLESIMVHAVIHSGEVSKHIVAYPGAALPAKAVAVHAQVAGGAALNVTTAFTLPLPRRALQVLIGVGGVACTITVTGTAVDGSPLVKTATVTAAGTFAVGGGADIFETITSMVSNIDPVGTTDLQTADAFGLGFTFQSAVTPLLSADGVIEAVAASSPSTGGIKPTTAPNGTHAYTVEVAPTQL